MDCPSSAPARKPWQWLLAIAAVALLVGILSALFLVPWRPYILGRALSAYLQTSVTVQGVTGGWWNGATVHQLTIAEDPTPQAATLVRVERLTVNLPVVSLLFSSKPLTLHLDGVRLDLHRRQGGQWNLLPLLKALEVRASARPDSHATVPKLNRQATVTVTRGTLRLGEEVEVTNFAIGLHLAPGKLTIRQAEASIAGGVIALQGEVPLHELSPDRPLQWRLAGVRLDRLLGPAFQPVTIAEATGHLTQQGDGFSLGAAMHLPTFTLSPGTLGKRQPHLTHAALTCTLRLLPPFTRLAMEECRLHAAEAQLSLRGSTVDLAPEPQLALQVDGSLAARLVGALAPEVPGQFLDQVRVRGQITAPLRGEVWHSMDWRLAVTSERFVFGDTFNAVHVTVVKSADRLEIADLHATHGTGRIHGTGAWRLAEPVDGGLQVEMDHISLRQPLPQGAAESHYLVEGALSGSIAWRIDDDGEHVTVDGRVHTLQLRHATAALVQIPEGSIQGKLGRDRDGTWRGDRLAFRSDGLAAELRDVIARRTPTHYDLSGALDLKASAGAITGLTGGLLPDRLQVSGPVAIAGTAAGHIPVDKSISLRDLTYTGEFRLAQLAWDGTPWETVTARFTVAQGRLTIDDSRARILGGWMRLGPDTFVDLQGPRRDFQVHLTAEQLDLRLETGKRMPLLALLIPLFLLEPDRRDPIRMSGMFDAQIHASGTYDGQPGWSQSINGDGYFRIAQGAVVGSTVISGFVTKALALPANVVDQSVKALLERTGKPLQVLESLLRRSYTFGTLASPIELRAGKIHLADNLTVNAPEFSLVLNGYSTIDGTVDYDVHSDLIHRLLFGEVINLAEELPVLGTVLRHTNPFQLIHRHLELSATVQGNLFQRNTTGQPGIHIDVHVVQ